MTSPSPSPVDCGAAQPFSLLPAFGEGNALTSLLAPPRLPGQMFLSAASCPEEITSTSKAQQKFRLMPTAPNLPCEQHVDTNTSPELTWLWCRCQVSLLAPQCTLLPALLPPSLGWALVCPEALPICIWVWICWKAGQPAKPSEMFFQELGAVPYLLHPGSTAARWLLWGRAAGGVRPG